MKKAAAITAASLAIMAAACTGVPVGTLNNQGAFGQSAIENQAIQIAYATPERLRDLSKAFHNAVPSMVNFEFNSTALDGEARNILRQQAEWIKRFPAVRFTVVGHTDLVGGAGFNQGLGLRRAQAIVAFLRSRGVKANQLHAVESRGESNPIVRTADPERLNRRTVTTVSGYSNAARGTGMDGKRALIVYNEYVGDEGSEVVAETQ